MWRHQLCGSSPGKAMLGAGCCGPRRQGLFWGGTRSLFQLGSVRHHQAPDQTTPKVESLGAASAERDMDHPVPAQCVSSHTATSSFRPAPGSCYRHGDAAVSQAEFTLWSQKTNRGDQNRSEYLRCPMA